MTKEIIQKDAPTLRDIAREVDITTLPNPKVSQLLNDMSAALATAKDGVAIAAPQIDVPLRIFIIAGKIIGENELDKVFINPTITKTSKETEIMGEGCLSVQGYYGNVIRNVKATVEAWDENGNKFTLGGSGLIAQIFQHEIDHLNGILYIDKAEDVTVVSEN